MWHSVRLLTSITGLAIAAGAVQAQSLPQATIEVPLGMAIAIQGDQALEDIRSEMTSELASSVALWMSTSLRQAPLTDAVPAGGDAAPDDIIVMAIDR